MELFTVVTTFIAVIVVLQQIILEKKVPNDNMLQVEFVCCPEPAAELSFQQTTFLLSHAALLAKVSYVKELVQNIPVPSRLPSQTGSMLERLSLQPTHYSSHTEGRQGAAELLQLGKEGWS